MDEDAKKIVLARRARFLVAALASAGLAGQACGLTERNPENTPGAGGTTGAGSGGRGACLSLWTGGFGGSSGSSGGSAPCLTFLPSDAGTDAETDAGSKNYCEQGGAGGESSVSAGGEGGAGCIPAPCLTPVR